MLKGRSAVQRAPTLAGMSFDAIVAALRDLCARNGLPAGDAAFADAGLAQVCLSFFY
jgi:hypothetical protein